MTPPAKRLLPPDSSTGAASSIITLTPRSRAANAAHSAAFPFPTTRMSACCMSRPLRHPCTQFFPRSVIARGVLDGKLRRLRLDPLEGRVALLKKRVTGTHTGPRVVAGLERIARTFDFDVRRAGQREINLFDRVIVTAAHTADIQLAAHHEEMIRAELVFHEAVDLEPPDTRCVANHRFLRLELSDAMRAHVVELGRRCRGCPYCRFDEDRVFEASRELRLRRRHLEPVNGRLCGVAQRV